MASTARRKLLKFISLGSAALTVGGYSAYRGLRLPPFRWDPNPPVNSKDFDDFEIFANDCIFLPSGKKERHYEGGSVSLRAYAPEPTLSLSSDVTQLIEISVENLAPDAVLEISGESSGVSLEREDIAGISRALVLSFTQHASCQLKWKLPNLGAYEFAAIGDTGGADELDWCIKRAHSLRARFLFHLGDFNYQDGDYENAINLFRNAPLPCYICIGNHDFHANGAIYQSFLENIGPLNNYFSIGNTRFVNFDTASNFVPFGAGERGRLFKELIADNSHYVDSVAFSHRPLYDPIVAGDHDIGNEGERDWLITSLKQANITTLLSGHIHIHHRETIQGIDNLIVGQGLGHQDLITNSDYSKIAIGQVSKEGLVNIEIRNLGMPMKMHCHPRSDPVKQSLEGSEYLELLKRIKEHCIRKI